MKHSIDMKSRMKLIICILIAVAFIAGCGAGAWQSAKTDYTAMLQQTKPLDWPAKKLKKRFALYWGLRYEGDPEKTFVLEAPHIQEMAPRPRYEFFVEQTAVNKLSGIEVVDLIQESDYVYEIQFYLNLKTRRGEVKRIFYKDRWLDLHGEWYHLFQNQILFPKLL